MWFAVPSYSGGNTLVHCFVRRQSLIDLRQWLRHRSSIRTGPRRFRSPQSGEPPGRQLSGCRPLWGGLAADRERLVDDVGDRHLVPGDPAGRGATDEEGGQGGTNVSAEEAGYADFPVVDDAPEAVVPLHSVELEHTGQVGSWSTCRGGGRGQGDDQARCVGVGPAGSEGTCRREVEAWSVAVGRGQLLVSVEVKGSCRHVDG